MRLIDADTMITDIRECIEAQKSNYEWAQVKGLRVALECIDEAPIIDPKLQWIPVDEKMPEEKDSIFARYYGTGKWNKSMFRKTSEKVLVTVEYKDGERVTDVTNTNDGEWWNDTHFIPRKVLAWMPLPEPYKPEEDT